MLVLIGTICVRYQICAYSAEAVLWTVRTLVTVNDERKIN